MAISAAIVVANINYIQPIEADIAQQFNLPNAVIGAVAMLTQLGYAFGLLLIVPMGDIMNRRMLIMRLLVLAIISALLAFVAPNIWVYALASLLIGITSVVPQVIIPYAGFLAPRNQRGQRPEWLARGGSLVTNCQWGTCELFALADGLSDCRYLDCRIVARLVAKITA